MCFFQKVAWAKAFSFQLLVGSCLAAFTHDSLDLTLTDPTMKGFWGGFSDDTYGYVVPNHNGDSLNDNSFGKIGRFALNDFSSVAVLDLADTDPTMKGFIGGFTDGTYGYVVPNFNQGYRGKIGRFSLHDFSSVVVLDLTLTDGTMKGFRGGFTDGTYGYVVPANNENGAFGKIGRFALNDFSSVAVLDLTLTDPAMKGFDGGFSDGTYGYVVPNNNGARFGKVGRFALNDFSSVTVLNLKITDPSMKGFYGGFTDGTYGYVVPNKNPGFFGKIGRFALNDFSSVTVLDLRITDPTMKGFSGGFTDGTYGYVVPNQLDGSNYHGKIGRFALNDFITVTVLDLTITDPTMKGFRGGFTDGCYGYLVPLGDLNGAKFGKIGRIAVSQASTTTSQASTTTSQPAATTSLVETTNSVSATTTSLIETTNSVSSLKSTSTPATILLVGDFSFTINVTQAHEFIQEVYINSAMKMFVAQLLEIEEAWIYNLNVTLVAPQRLLTSALLFDNTTTVNMTRSRRMFDLTTKSGVRINFEIHIPSDGGPDQITATLLIERFDRVSLVEATNVLNKVISSGVLGSNDYEVEVVTKLVLPAETTTTTTTMPSPHETDDTLLMLIVILVICTCTVGVLLVLFHASRVIRKRSYGKMQRRSLISCESPKNTSNQSRLMSPPASISFEMADRLRSSLKAMLDPVTPAVFISFAFGQRVDDDLGCGPGLFHAAAVISALHKRSIPCYCSLNDDHSDDIACQRILCSEASSCGMFLVVETMAFYSSSSCFEQVRMGLRSNMTISRIRFECTPHVDEQWCTISVNESTLSKVVSELQIRRIVPSDDSKTIQDSPHDLQLFAAELSLRLGDGSFSCRVDSRFTLRLPSSSCLAVTSERVPAKRKVKRKKTRLGKSFSEGNTFACSSGVVGPDLQTLVSSTPVGKSRSVRPNAAKRVVRATSSS